MGRISVTETDNSTYVNGSTDDNIVYIPGTAITGESGEPTLVTSYDNFVNSFGSHGCADDPMTFDIVSEILLSGFKVLFYRVTDSNCKNSESTIKFGKDNDNIIINISYKHTGTLGNNFSANFKNANGIILQTINNGVIKENIRLSNNQSSSVVGSEDENVVKLFNILESLNKITTSKNIDSDESVISSKYLDVKVTLKDGNDLTLENVKSAIETDTASTIITEKFEDKEYQLSGGTDIAYSDFKTELRSNDKIYNSVKDKYLYYPKFIISTISGDTDINKKLLSLAESREDCLALIDPDINAFSISTDPSNIVGEIDSDYGAMYAPWQYCKLSRSDADSYKWMPPSCVFLCTLASYIQNDSNKLYDIPAGTKFANRNIIKSKFDIGESILDEWQNGDISINPIMKLRNYGYVVYGQKTLKRVDSSVGERSLLQQVGVRITLNEIKRSIFNICLDLSFEENIYEVWEEFERRLSDEILDTLVSSNRISDYDIKLGYNEDNRLKVVGKVTVYYNDSLEYFDINVSVNNSDIESSISLEESYKLSSEEDIDE